MGTDVCSNWGNWVAAAGMTGGRINHFNITKQSKASRHCCELPQSLLSVSCPSLDQQASCCEVGDLWLLN